jgi:hypothetical protein
MEKCLSTIDSPCTRRYEPRLLAVDDELLLLCSPHILPSPRSAPHMLGDLPAACLAVPSPLHGRMQRPRAWRGSNFLASSTAAWRSPPYAHPRRPDGALPVLRRLLSLVGGGPAEQSERCTRRWWPGRASERRHASSRSSAAGCQSPPNVAPPPRASRRWPGGPSPSMHSASSTCS